MGVAAQSPRGARNAASEVGDDAIFPGAGEDWLCGDAGNDQVHGGNGNVYGGDNAADLFGGNGDDGLDGEDRDDVKVQDQAALPRPHPLVRRFPPGARSNSRRSRLFSSRAVASFTRGATVQVASRPVRLIAPAMGEGGATEAPIRRHEEDPRFERV